MSDLMTRINALKDAYRTQAGGRSPMQLYLNAVDTTEMTRLRSDLDRFPVKILAMTVHENAAETRVE